MELSRLAPLLAKAQLLAPIGSRPFLNFSTMASAGSSGDQGLVGHTRLLRLEYVYLLHLPLSRQGVVEQKVPGRPRVFRRGFESHPLRQVLKNEAPEKSGAFFFARRIHAVPQAQYAAAQ